MGKGVLMANFGECGVYRANCRKRSYRRFSTSGRDGADGASAFTMCVSFRLPPSRRGMRDRDYGGTPEPTVRVLYGGG